MEFLRLRDCLDDDYARLREMIAITDRAARVPSCPDWSVDDLARHVAHAYLHKAYAMAHNAMPDSWPPDTAAEPTLKLLDRAYTEMCAQFAGKPPAAPSVTWYEPDQTVGFWIRRMAQETVIHRVDAELAASVQIAPIPEDLALDGIDEVLMLFLAYASTAWAEAFDLTTADGRSVLVDAGARRWLVRPTGESVEAIEVSGLTDADADADAAATVRADAERLLLWLWRRASDDTVSIAGDRGAVAEVWRQLGSGTR